MHVCLFVCMHLRMYVSCVFAWVRVRVCVYQVVWSYQGSAMSLQKKEVFTNDGATPAAGASPAGRMIV